MPERVPISKNKEFKPIKNAVIIEAMSLSDEYVYEIPESDNENAETFNLDEAESVNAHRDDVTHFTAHGSGRDDMYMLYKMAKELLDKNREGYDPKEAIRLLYRSAMIGYECAQYQLGEMLLFGKFVERNTEVGLALLNSAKEQGNIHAGILLENYMTHQNELSANAAIAMVKLIGKMSSIIEKNIDAEIRKGASGLTEGKLRREINEKKVAQGIRM
jgi:TPR repeat protein